MPAEVHLFGIRHHGPGSARRLIAALEALRPAAVLIEGPADASGLIPFLADPAMVPPVALLTYAAEDPSQAIFWPFAVHSPEYQAARWALANGAETRFIDLPASRRLAASGSAGDEDTPEEPSDPVTTDPIGALARAAGYEDGESWWRDVIEESPDPGPVFDAVADAMTALRREAAKAEAPKLGPPKLESSEALREAHMRLEIARAAQAAEGPVAVVCGAWHVPALMERRARKDDRALLAGGRKRRVAATWAPWTSPRLALAGGYGAGIAAPGWCRHLWDTPHDQAAPRWLARIAAALRAEGHLVSTASLIEAQRLARALAALRGRPAPGFEELREASVACLCFGERLVWETIAPALLAGNEVGAIPEGVPLAPLLEDLQRQQARLRLKPEALERRLALDLRSAGGLARSTLLHRLSILGVDWGRLDDAGRSRGTFRERWTLAWQPELAVRLVESLVYGATIEAAAAGRLRAGLAEAHDLPALAGLARQALTAQLPEAAHLCIERLSRRAAETGDCGELLAALPSLADILRYGQARATDAGALAALMARIALGAGIALPYAARNLDAEAARALADRVRKADAAIALSELATDVTEIWHGALDEIAGDGRAGRLVSGVAGRLLYEAGRIAPEAAAGLLARNLSPAETVADAAAYFEGFFEGGGTRLIHDDALRDAVDAWVMGLRAEVFVEHLPLFRRVFAGLDRSERRHLLEAATRGEGAGVPPGLVLAPDADRLWARQLARIAAILAAKSPEAGGGDA